MPLSFPTIVQDVKIYNRILNTVIECKYLGVVLSDGLTCTRDVERAKVSFFNQFYSLYNKFYCMDQKLLIYLFKLHAMSFYGVEAWFMKLHTKVLNNILIAYCKAIKRMCNIRPYESNHECLERVNLLTFNHLGAKILINFAFSVLHSKSPCLSSHK